MANNLPQTQFIDIAELEDLARKQVAIDLDNLARRETKSGGLSEIDKAEKARLTLLSNNLSSTGLKFDPLFATARYAFNRGDSGLQQIAIDHTNGVLKLTAPVDVVRIGLVLGLLRHHAAPLPLLIATGSPAATTIGTGGQPPPAIEPQPGHVNLPRFEEALFQMVGRVGGRLPLAEKVLTHLGEIVDPNPNGSRVSSVEYAKVFEKLVAAGVEHSDPKLKQRIEESLDRVLLPDDERPQHQIAIKLPDLEATTDYQVVKDNIELMGPMIFASMFDELKAFQVVDRLIEMSQRNEISLIKGTAGDRLYNYWRNAPNRMSEMERQTFYAMTLGIPTGQPGVAVNTEFQDLWIRFVSSVSSLVRETRVDQLLRSTLPVAINQQQVKKAARDLTSNMSLYGYGMAFYAAVDLQTQINEMIELLQDPDLRSVFGARDMWGVIDQVAQVELGGARNSSKYRTLATCGAIITAWLANNLARLKDATLPMVDLRDVENPPPRPSGQTATSHPTDYDLVNACELWLADSAMGDDRVEELSQPRESPQQPGRPIQIPSIARDLLEGTGLGLEMSAGGGRPNGRFNGQFNGRRGSSYRSY